ncbi:DUF721 domain-containing protein [bacterium]|nr:DUF721 domain-containing protein [bacterium]
MSDLEKIGEGLDALLRQMGIPAQGDVERLVDEWASLAGEPWSTRAHPAGLRGGELTVDADDAAVATVLKYRVAELIERLNIGLGVDLVSTVKVRVGPRRKNGG